MLLFTLLPLILLSTLTTAANLTRTFCTCTSAIHRGYSLTFTFTPHDSANSTLSCAIHDRCVSEMGPGGCNEDVTYLKKYTITQNNHTFAYHRNLFGLDKYEFDGSGVKKVPVKEARELGDGNVTRICDGECGQVENSLRADCGGSQCEAQWFRIADL